MFKKTIASFLFLGFISTQGQAAVFTNAVEDMENPIGVSKVIVPNDSIKLLRIRALSLKVKCGEQSDNENFIEVYNKNHETSYFFITGEANKSTQEVCLEVARLVVTAQEISKAEGTDVLLDLNVNRLTRSLDSIAYSEL